MSVVVVAVPVVDVVVVDVAVEDVVVDVAEIVVVDVVVVLVLVVDVDNGSQIPFRVDTSLFRVASTLILPRFLDSAFS